MGHWSKRGESSSMATAGEQANAQKGFLGWVERTGNKLPDPVFIFIWLIGALIAVSIFVNTDIGFENRAVQFYLFVCIWFSARSCG